MKTIAAFLLGVWEFRHDCTTRHDTASERNAYDVGREFAHRITLRHWDN